MRQSRSLLVLATSLIIAESLAFGVSIVMISVADDRATKIKRYVKAWPKGPNLGARYTHNEEMIC